MTNQPDRNVEIARLLGKPKRKPDVRPGLLLAARLMLTMPPIEGEHADEGTRRAWARYLQRLARRKR